MSGPSPAPEPSTATWRGVLLMVAASTAIQMGLFGPQEIVPVLAQQFHRSSHIVGVAVNAATLGMAVCGLLWSGYADRFERKRMIVAVLLVLSLFSGLTDGRSSFASFVALRFIQGLLMCAAVVSAMAYIGEKWGPAGTAPLVMAGFVSGNVVSNMASRMLMGAVAQYAGWHRAFLAVGVINFTGAVLLWMTLPSASASSRRSGRQVLVAMGEHLRDPRLRAANAIGFLLLFAFVGTFTYINDVLSSAPFSLSPARLGALYAAFGPSLALTPLAGSIARGRGHRAALILAAGTTIGGVALTLSASLTSMMLGVALVGAGLFSSQAVTTSFIAIVAREAKGAAMSLYLACYYLGGLAGAWVVGEMFQMRGWRGCAGVIAAAALGMAVLGAGWWPRGSGMTRSGGSDPGVLPQSSM